MWSLFGSWRYLFQRVRVRGSKEALLKWRGCSSLVHKWPHFCVPQLQYRLCLCIWPSSHCLIFRDTGEARAFPHGKYSWPLKNIDSNCVGPIIGGFLSFLFFWVDCKSHMAFISNCLPASMGRNLRWLAPRSRLLPWISGEAHWGH